jgi:hypothetical protein
MHDGDVSFDEHLPLKPEPRAQIGCSPPWSAFHSVKYATSLASLSHRRWCARAARAVGMRSLWLLLALAGCYPSRESLTAGQIGCPPNEVSTSKLGSSTGWSQSAETWAAQCRGRRFICTEVTTSGGDWDWLWSDSLGASDTDVSCREELGPSDSALSSRPGADRVRPARSEPPTGGAGFELGISRAASRERCQAATHLWQEDESQHATCSGTASSLGLPAKAQLTFCGRELCGITVSHTPEAHWMRPFSDLNSTLTAKYGTASKRQTRIPSMCRTDAQFDSCARDGTLSLSVSWQWPTGQRLRLSLGRPSPHTGESAVRITYVKAPSSARVDASAL